MQTEQAWCYHVKVESKTATISHWDDNFDSNEIVQKDIERKLASHQSGINVLIYYKESIPNFAGILMVLKQTNLSYSWQQF